MSAAATTDTFHDLFVSWMENGLSLRDFRRLQDLARRCGADLSEMVEAYES